MLLDHRAKYRNSWREHNVVLALLPFLLNVDAFPTFYPAHMISEGGCRVFGACAAHSKEASENVELAVEEIRALALELWEGDEIPILDSTERNESSSSSIMEGEANLAETVKFGDRAEYFRQEALKGCPKSQHSYGLMLWNGFGNVERDARVSVKFHAAAAFQNHLDGMAVLGGCLRTGTGLKQNVALGLRIIEYCASVGNPSGINKKAALLELNKDEFHAVDLYEKCLEGGRVNALLLFNLGWCLVNGQGVYKKDVDRGIALWKEATKRAPDEGSEEAAWYLYQEYKRDLPADAEQWFALAEELGYYD